jgi:hypothetical protein
MDTTIREANIAQLDEGAVLHIPKKKRSNTVISIFEAEILCC